VRYAVDVQSSYRMFFLFSSGGSDGVPGRRGCLRGAAVGVLPLPEQEVVLLQHWRFSLLRRAPRPQTSPLQRAR